MEQKDLRLESGTHERVVSCIANARTIGSVDSKQCCDMSRRSTIQLIFLTVDTAMISPSIQNSTNSFQRYSSISYHLI